MRDTLPEPGSGGAALAPTPHPPRSHAARERGNPVRAPSAARGTEALDAIVAEFGIIIVPTSRRRRPGETHARGALREILRDHGADHLRQVLRLIRGTEPNREALWSEVFSAVSDCLVTEPTWPAREAELEVVFNHIHLERGRERAVGLRPWPVRSTLRVWLWKRLDEALRG